MERNEDRLGTEVGHKRKEPLFNSSDLRVSSSRNFPSHMNMPLACLLSSAAQQAVQYKEEAVLAKSNLEESQKKLQSVLFQEKQQADTIQELQRELQKLQKDSLMTEEELVPNRYHRFTSRERLCPLQAGRDIAGSCPGVRHQTPRG